MKIPTRVRKKTAYGIIGIYLLFIGLGVYSVQRFYFDQKNFYRMKIQELKNDLSEASNDHKIVAQLGKTYFEYGKKNNSNYYYELAKDQYEEAFSLEPNEISYQYQLGLIYNKLGQEEHAVQMFEHILKSDPFNVYGNYELAMIHKENKKYDQAIEYLKQALKVETSSATLLYEIGAIYEKKSDYKSAQSYYKTALKYIPDYKEAKDALEKLPKDSSK